jgi:hypothetical protein
VQLPVLQSDVAATAFDRWASKPIFTARGVYQPPQSCRRAAVPPSQLDPSSIRTAQWDANARRVLLLTVVDTLERLTGRPIEVLSSLRMAKDCLEEVSSRMPRGGVREGKTRSLGDEAAAQNIKVLRNATAGRGSIDREYHHDEPGEDFSGR